MKVMIKWEGDEPLPEKVVEQFDQLEINCIGNILDSQYYLHNNQSLIIFETVDFRDLFRFALGITVVICENHEQITQDLSLEFNLGKVNVQKLQEKVNALIELLRTTAKDLREARVFPGKKISSIRQNLERNVVAAIMTQ